MNTSDLCRLFHSNNSNKTNRFSNIEGVRLFDQYTRQYIDKGLITKDYLPNFECFI